MDVLRACSFFAQGRCNKGDACSFARLKDTTQQPSLRPCSFFAQGRCTKGPDCTFAHVRGARQQPITPPPARNALTAAAPTYESTAPMYPQHLPAVNPIGQSAARPLRHGAVHQQAHGRGDVSHGLVGKPWLRACVHPRRHA